MGVRRGLWGVWGRRDGSKAEQRCQGGAGPASQGARCCHPLQSCADPARGRRRRRKRRKRPPQLPATRKGVPSSTAGDAEGPQPPPCLPRDEMLLPGGNARGGPCPPQQGEGANTPYSPFTDQGQLAPDPPGRALTGGGGTNGHRRGPSGRRRVPGTRSARGGAYEVTPPMTTPPRCGAVLAPPPPAG